MGELKGEKKIFNVFFFPDRKKLNALFFHERPNYYVSVDSYYL